jgi:hypothetical protein
MTGTGYRMGSDGPTIRQRRGSDASDARRSADLDLEPGDGFRVQDRHCHHRLESEEDRRTDHDRHHQADRAASGSYRACAECPGERAACPASQPRHDRDRRPCLCRDRGPRLYL